MSIGKIAITVMLPAAIMAAFRLWDKTQVRKTLLCLLILEILSEFGADILLKNIYTDGTTYERLLFVGLISIPLAAGLAVFLKKEKLTGDTILKMTCLICVLAAGYSVLTKGQASIHSDVATATLLIQSQIENRTFFPMSWQYANGDIWIVGINTLTFPFTVFLNNQSLARMLGSASLIVAALLGMIFMSRKLFHNNFWLLMIPLFLVFHPNNYVTNNNILWEAAYTSQMLWMTLSFTLSFYAIFKKNKASIFLYALLAFTLNAQGIRFAAEHGIPLIGAYCIYTYCEYQKKGDTDRKELAGFLIRAILIIGVPMVVGLGAYKYLCSYHNVNDGRSAMSFVSSSAEVWKNIETYLQYLFESFGYNHGVRLVSADGIWNLFVLVLCPLMCFIIPILQALKLQTEKAEVTLFFAFGLLHNALLFITIVLFGNVDSSRYLLSTVFVDLAVSARYIYVYWLKENSFSDYLWSTTFAAFALLACFILVSQSRGWAGAVFVQKQFNQSLIERNLNKGYATYWNAYKNEIYSDLNVRYGGVNIINDKKVSPFLWLVDEKVFSPEEKDTFLLLGEQENDVLSANIPLLFGRPKDVIHENDVYIYIFDHDIALNMEPLADGILKPIELNGNETAVLENGQYVLSSGAIVYGPYGKLKAGEYEVTFTGENINRGDCDIYSGRNGQAISYSEVSSSNKERVFDLVLFEDVNDIEFRIFNKESEEQITLFQIDVSEKLQQSVDLPNAA